MHKDSSFYGLFRYSEIEIEPYLMPAPKVLLKWIKNPRRRTSKQIYMVFQLLNEPTRFHITNSLAGTGNNEIQKFLVRILKDDLSLLVRHEAAFALGCIGNRKAASVLRFALANDDSFLVRHEAALSLSEVSSAPKDISALRKGLKDKSNEVVVSCQVALQRLEEKRVRKVGKLKSGLLV